MGEIEAVSDLLVGGGTGAGGGLVAGYALTRLLGNRNNSDGVSNAAICEKIDRTNELLAENFRELLVSMAELKGLLSHRD